MKSKILTVALAGLLLAGFVLSGCKEEEHNYVPWEPPVYEDPTKFTTYYDKEKSEVHFRESYYSYSSTGGTLYSYWESMLKLCDFSSTELQEGIAYKVTLSGTVNAYLDGLNFTILSGPFEYKDNVYGDRTVRYSFARVYPEKIYIPAGQFNRYFTFTTRIDYNTRYSDYSSEYNPDDIPILLGTSAKVFEGTMDRSRKKATISNFSMVIEEVVE